MSGNFADNPQGGAPAPDPKEPATTEPTPETQDNEAEIDEETGEPVTPPDDTEEVEHEGQKYKLPKALKGALLMQQDYTRKTQEVAESRKALEEQSTSLRQQAEWQQTFASDVGRMVALTDQVKAFEALNWAQLRQANRDEADDLWFQYQQVKDATARAAGELQNKVNNRSQETQRETAKRLEEGRAILQRDIKDWSPEYAGKLTDFSVRELGFTAQEIAAVSDPRIIKALHRAFQGEQAIRKAAAATKLNGQEGLRPVPTVGSTANATTISPTSSNSDKRMSDAEWMRRRNDQLRKKG